ncbi:hypothetical protein MGSAQ_001476 [marine sediment metagenome]|uniref:Uncharacterized protein n=1 Tax=marine sediment metagenome TaxID=412755 RepID=A0A1B6NU88_9ZZZZ
MVPVIIHLKTLLPESKTMCLTNVMAKLKLSALNQAVTYFTAIPSLNLAVR